MTRKNLNLKSKSEPILLIPCGKDYMWGGERLKRDFLKEINISPLAETWECSTHPDGSSIVANGVNKGKELSEVLMNHPEYLGTHIKTKGELPILIKLIDAKENLSVQVHPNDEYAQKYENGALGKTEMWYVLDAAKDAKLIYGFQHNVEKKTLEKAIQTGTIEKYLQKIKVHKDDIFFIEAGTIHAIGAGIVLAEIQENSNLTYRLYDYERVDKNGNKREIHVDKALDVINLKRSSSPRQPLRVLNYKRGRASELLCRCKYFQVERWIINTERNRNMVDFRTDNTSFEVFLCLSGCGVIFGNSESLSFFKGDCIFVPANSVPLKLHGKAQLLKISC